MFYLPAIFLLISFLFQMVSLCVLGLFIEITVSSSFILSKSKLKKIAHVLLFFFTFSQNDRIEDATLELKWYYLSVQEQRLHNIFTVKCQNPILLTVGGVRGLNMLTCSDVSIRTSSKTIQCL